MMAQGGTTPLPQEIPGFGPVRPFAGAFADRGPAAHALAEPRAAATGSAKVLPGIRAAIEACGLKDGATVSFHHHLRNGDGVLNAVMAEVAALGLKDIRVAASSIFPVRAPLLEHIRSGVVTGVTTSYVAGRSPSPSARARWRRRRSCKRMAAGRAPSRAASCGSTPPSSRRPPRTPAATSTAWTAGRRAEPSATRWRTSAMPAGWSP
jgi:citrate lyase subunit alpha / citrate CoA-transferase